MCRANFARFLFSPGVNHIRAEDEKIYGISLRGGPTVSGRSSSFSRPFVLLEIVRIFLPFYKEFLQISFGCKNSTFYLEIHSEKNS